MGDRHAALAGPAHPARHSGSELECGDGPIRCGLSPDVLDQIRDPAVRLALWERSLAEDFAAWLDELPIDRLPDSRVLADRATLPSAIAAMLDAAGTPAGKMRTMLVDDIAGLADLFMAILGSQVVDIRLDTVHHDACWKFHRDHVPARLLTTYRGPGTQWIRPADGAEALTRQRSYRGPIQQFPRHAVGLFRNRCAAEAGSILHRSPPIADTGIARLLLCLNPLSAASPDLWRGA